MKSLKVMSFQELTTSAIDVVGQPLKMLETFSGTKCSNFMAICPLPPGRPSRFICVPDICRSKAELFALCGCRLVLGRSKTSKKNDRGVQESRSCRGCIFLLAFQLGDLSMSQSSVETEGNSFASVQDELLR